MKINNQKQLDIILSLIIVLLSISIVSNLCDVVLYIMHIFSSQ